MSEQVLAAVRTAPSTTELREFELPRIPDDGALLRVEVAGICGTDVKMYAKPVIQRPVIMGHENVGTIVEARPHFVERQGLGVGHRVFVEHYVACYRCEWCRLGEYRHFELTDWRTNPDARRYGYTTCENPYHLWGGFAQYMYLPWNAVIHAVPDNVTDAEAGIITPLSNGIQWALVDARIGFIELTGGKGVDVVLDCTAGAGTMPILIAQLASKRFPLERLTTHAFRLADVHIAIKAVGGKAGDGVIHVSLLPWQD